MDPDLKVMLTGMPAATRLARALSEESGHMRFLTGLRGWAALWVFMYHAWAFAKHPPLNVELFALSVELTPLFSMGGAGVTIFFVLSGFLLATPFAQWQAGKRERPSLGRYFLRRVMRVFPAYYLQLAVLILIAWWTSGQAAIPDPASFIRHLLMLFMPPPLGVEPNLNLVWWTLPIEFAFYLALPFMAFMLRPSRGLWLLLGCLAAMYLWRHGVVVRLADAPLQMRVHAAYQLPGSMDAFGFGMLTAVLHANRSNMPAWLLSAPTSNRLGLLGIGLLLAAIYWLPGRRAEYWSDNLIFYAWTPALSLGIAAALLAGVGGSGVLQKMFGNRYMVFLGLISYSLYLWHFPVLGWLAAASWYPSVTGGHLAWILALALPVTLAISTLSYLAVERPFMMLNRTRRVA
jgi:peptidoglycan/LPS O-acetylase OafA/YrhL